LAEFDLKWDRPQEKVWNYRWSEGFKDPDQDVLYLWISDALFGNLLSLLQRNLRGTVSSTWSRGYYPTNHSQIKRPKNQFQDIPKDSLRTTSSHSKQFQWLNHKGSESQKGNKHGFWQ